MNGHGETLETFLAFRDGERVSPEPRCAGCGKRKPDVGEVTIDGEDFCLACGLGEQGGFYLLDIARTAERGARVLTRLAEAYHVGRISYEVHTARNGRTWRFIERHAAQVSTLAILRRLDRERERA